MRLFQKIFFYAILITFFIHSEGHSQSIQSEIKNLSEGADMIVTGKVVDQKSEWSSDKSKIYTNVTIQVDEFLKGSNNQNRIVIKNLGGEVGNVGETYSHVPTFQDDEDVLLFVKKSTKDESLRVFEGDEGKLTLYHDKNTGEKVTSNNIKASEMKKEIKNYVEKQ
jgi:hypothetical protein